MARFSEQFIQQVAQATDIVELVSQYVALTKRGREYVCVCPFHDDHKPSMYVAPAKQIFKCFSCGAGGGVFQFMCLYEKLSFPEAVKALAERAHIPLPAESCQAPAGPGGMSKTDLAEVMTFAASFYRAQLRGQAGEAALAYARGRGFTDDSIERFGLGYAPSGWDSLLRAARGRNVRDAQLAAAGLVIQRDEGGYYDRFRDRLMFPILDPAGKVIAFGGRALDPNDRAKYLNSAESILFDKSSNLFALNWAREGIVATGTAVVAEGYLDALIPLQAGVSNIVATLGTSLTEQHVRLLSRYAREAVLVFDADAAGAKAADRGLEMFLAQRIHVRVATIPAGKDPCDFVLAEGAEAFVRLVSEAPDALQYAWDRRQAAWQAAGGNLASRGAVVEDFLRIVVTSTSYDAIDEIRRGQLAQHIGHMLNIPAPDLQQQMRRMAKHLRRGDAQNARGARAAVESWAPDAAAAQAERELLEVLVNMPDMFDIAAERIDWRDFQDPSLRKLAERLWALGQAHRLTLEDLLADEALMGLGGLLTDLSAAGEKKGNYEATLHGALSHILYLREGRQMAQPPAEMYSDEALNQVLQRHRQDDLRRHPKIT
jgi:DNA primase